MIVDTGREGRLPLMDVRSDIVTATSPVGNVTISKHRHHTTLRFRKLRGDWECRRPTIFRIKTYEYSSC